jgi:hypothetical protein
MPGVQMQMAGWRLMSRCGQGCVNGRTRAVPVLCSCWAVMQIAYYSAILSRSREVRHVGNSRASPKNEGGNTLALESILYISNQATSSNSVLAALEASGGEVVGTDSATQAIALLFIMHSVAVVVLHYRASERTSFDLVRSLRAIRPTASGHHGSSPCVWVLRLLRYHILPSGLE